MPNECYSEAVDFVVDVAVVVFVVNVVVVALLAVTGNITCSCGKLGYWGGIHFHFHVQSNNSVEVVLWLCCVVVGVVTVKFPKTGD